MSAMAAAFVRMSDGLIFGSPSFRRETSRSRSASVSVMSIVAESWNAGIAAASVRRRTIVLRTFVSGTFSTSPGWICAYRRGNRAAASAGAAAGSKRSTSSATMRPSGPVPRIWESSTPFSRAIRRASGEALIRPPSAGAAGSAAGASSCAGSSAPAAASASGAEAPFVDAGAVRRSPGSGKRDLLARLADERDDGADRGLALAHRDLEETPSAVASTSWVTLSVSSS